MHVTLQTAIQFATLVSVIVGFLGLINTVNIYRRQMNVQILMQYTQRYERILDEFPEEALIGRFNSQTLPPEGRKLTLCVLKYLNLCSEEYYLWKHGYLAAEVWRIWEGDLKRMIASPLLQREWSSLRTEFVSHQAFLEYVEQVQAESVSGKVGSA